MKLANLVKIEWGDALKRTVLCKTLYGDMLVKASELEEKLQNHNLLAPIRKIYQDMLDFAQGRMGNNTDEQKTSGDGAGSA